MKYCPRCARELAERSVDGVSRRACLADGCTFVHWDNPVPVVASRAALGAFDFGRLELTARIVRDGLRLPLEAAAPVRGTR